MFANQQPILEQLAYNAWLRRGKPLGSADDDWKEACRLFAAMQDAQMQDARQSFSSSMSPGSSPTDLGADLVPETSHDQPKFDRSGDIEFHRDSHDDQLNPNLPAFKLARIDRETRLFLQHG